jgi:hypothetical protein
MHVENFNLNDDGNGSLKVRISKKELLDLLDTHHYFCHVFQNVLLEKFDHSFNLTPRQIRRIKFRLADIILVVDREKIEKFLKK